MTSSNDQCGLLELLRGDARHCGVHGWRVALLCAAAAFGINKFSAVFLFRIAGALHSHGRIGRVLASAATRLNSIVNSCEFSPAARIGPGLHLPHPIGIVCGAIDAGTNLKLMQQVTIGMRDPSQDYTDVTLYASIGDDVFIAAGAIIVGSVRIGAGAVIGANAVVLHDVPAAGTAVGNPARLLEHKPVALSVA